MVQMRPKVFIKLANHLYNIGAIKDLNLLSIEEKLFIFLLVFAANNSYYKVAEETQYSILMVYK